MGKFFYKTKPSLNSYAFVTTRSLNVVELHKKQRKTLLNYLQISEIEEFKFNKIGKHLCNEGLDGFATNRMFPNSIFYLCSPETVVSVKQPTRLKSASRQRNPQSDTIRYNYTGFNDIISSKQSSKKATSSATNRRSVTSSRRRSMY